MYNEIVFGFVFCFFFLKLQLFILVNTYGLHDMLGYSLRKNDRFKLYLFKSRLRAIFVFNVDFEVIIIVQSIRSAPFEHFCPRRTFVLMCTIPTPPIIAQLFITNIREYRNKIIQFSHYATPSTVYRLRTHTRTVNGIGTTHSRFFYSLFFPISETYRYESQVRGYGISGIEP